MSEKYLPALVGVPETLLIPLYVRAKEARRPDPMLRDEKAADLLTRIDFDFSRIKLRGHDELGIILRLREFDRFVRDFLTVHPDGVVVHIGCGLDTRFERVDNGRVEWYDLDLPEVIGLRLKLMREPGGRYHLLDCSVFDPIWMDRVGNHLTHSVLFVAEGVFPYFETAQIRSLLMTLRANFPGSELVFDAHTPLVVRMDNLQLALSGVDARLQFSLRHGRDVEKWNEGIRMLEEWFYFGTNEPRVRPYRWMNRIPFLRKSTGIFHFRLGNEPKGENE